MHDIFINNDIKYEIQTESCSNVQKTVFKLRIGFVRNFFCFLLITLQKKEYRRSLQFSCVRDCGGHCPPHPVQRLIIITAV